MITCRIS